MLLAHIKILPAPIEAASSALWTSSPRIPFPPRTWNESLSLVYCLPRISPSHEQPGIIHDEREGSTSGSRTGLSRASPQRSQSRPASVAIRPAGTDPSPAVSRATTPTRTILPTTVLRWTVPCSAAAILSHRRSLCSRFHWAPVWLPDCPRADGLCDGSGSAVSTTECVHRVLFHSLLSSAECRFSFSFL